VRVRNDEGMLDHEQLRALAERLMTVPGVVGVTLGGSRARGTHTAESDIDLGLYYRPPLDLQQLGEIARDTAGPDARVTSPGEWGPWVDGGAWLVIDNTPVDWIYRNIDRVHSSWAAARAGRFQFHFQVGHPLGVPDFAYAGEIALAVILADPTGELATLQEGTRDYPSALRRALVAALWEAGFAIGNAKKARSRTDTAYISGCLFRVVGLCAHALHGAAGRWLITEKGAVQAAHDLPNAPPEFALHAHRVLGHVGTTGPELDAAIADATELLAATTRACDAEG
jgi:hypothetical protein